ncbi:MAG: TetR/AcrR family transcriptional regulator [Saprospiraceae bacterium]
MATKAKKRFKEMRQRSEEKILNTALELFATNGYKNTSISGIAKKAEISKGLMYNYFESKQALLRAIISKALAEGHDLVQHAMEDYASPILELEHLVLDTFEHVKNNFQFWKLLTSLTHQQDIMTSVQDLVEKEKNWSIQKGIELFTKLKAPNPMQSAFLLGAAMDGIMLHYIHLGDEYPIDEMAKALVETFTHPDSIHLG